MDMSIYVLIIAMLLILGLMLYLYYRKEKNIKKALLLLSIVVLTAVFGLLLEETVNKFSNSPPSFNHNKVENVNEDTYQTDSTKAEGINGSNSNSTEDFYFPFSTKGSNITKTIGTKYCPAWLIIAYGILANLLFIGWSSDQRIPIFTKPFPWYVIKAITIILNVFIIYVFARLSSFMVSTIFSGLSEKAKAGFSISMCAFPSIVLPTIELYSLFYDNSYHKYDHMIKK